MEWLPYGNVTLVTCCLSEYPFTILSLIIIIRDYVLQRPALYFHLNPIYPLYDKTYAWQKRLTLEIPSMNLHQKAMVPMIIGVLQMP